MTYLIQTTVFARLKNQSVAEVRFRDNFSVTSILIVIANSSVTENSSRAKFDSRLFSSQQPLHRLSAVPLPLHRGGKRATAFICIISVFQYYFAYSAAASPCLPLTQVQFCGLAKQDCCRRQQSKISYLTAQRLNEGGFRVQLFTYILSGILSG